ncbi:hypothetical protein HK105_201320 [Polyrhizophydium stewartii]|uniref:t-SNARE coiled-coil homology domain-containing protein n=1 Tax=Polyrhizophydium stewartii TaxID=2732419 RepID=A0ABR4NHW1_9FUNG
MHWESDVARLQTVATDTTELLLERKRAAALRVPLEHIDSRIAANLAHVRQGIAAQEALLSGAETTGALPAAQLRGWEQAILDLSKQADRLAVLSEDATAAPSGRSRAPSAKGSAPVQASGQAAQPKPFVHIHDGAPQDTLDNGELVQLQTRIMERAWAATTVASLRALTAHLVRTCTQAEQDSHLDHLSEAIRRQKELGQLISNELDYHVELLDQTEQAIDSTQRHMQNANRRLGNVTDDQSTDSRSTCTIAILVLILILVIILTRTF